MKQVYQCDLCGHIELTELDIIEHEKKCRWNPANKMCRSCANTQRITDSCRTHGRDYIERFGEKGLCLDWKQRRNK